MRIWLVAVVVGMNVGMLLADPPPPYDVQASTGIQGRVTGFFHAEQLDQRWWLIDPNGAAFYIVGTDHINYDVHFCQKLGYAPYARNVRAKYGRIEKWAEATLARLKAWGFNTLPANHSPVLRHRGLPHIEFLSIGQAFAAKDNLCPQTGWTGFPNVFSPDWSAHCRTVAANRCAPVKDDPWLIGYFLDNELEWLGKTWARWGLFAEAWKKPASHAAKQAWIELLKRELKEPAAMAEHWGVVVSSFDELAKHTQPTTAMTERAREIEQHWQAEVAQRYFHEAVQAIRQQDPNHLILGCRYSELSQGSWEIAGQYCDVLSFNRYLPIDLERGVPADFIEELQEAHHRSGKPLMITEWSFPALDAGLPSTNGAGMRVETQQQRARCFEQFQSTMFRLPFMVGSDFFMWVDEPAEGISDVFPENSNYGLVNVRDEPYAELVAAATRLNPQACRLHQEGKWSMPVGGWLVDWMAKPTVRTKPASERPRFHVGELRIEMPEGGHAWRLWLKEVLLGDFYPLMMQETPGEVWVAPDTARVIATAETPMADIVDVEFEKSPINVPAPRLTNPGPTGLLDRPNPPRGYRSRWRFWIARQPTLSVGNGTAGWLASQFLSIENTDHVAWRLGAIFHFLEPRLGGEQANDELLASGYPMYYRNGAAWVDRAAGVGIGCGYTAFGTFWCNYRRDEHRCYSDLFRKVGQVLEPGHRYEVPSPPAFFYPLRALDVAGMSDAIGRIERQILLPPPASQP